MIDGTKAQSKRYETHTAALIQEQKCGDGNEHSKSPLTKSTLEVCING